MANSSLVAQFMCHKTNVIFDIFENEQVEIVALEDKVQQLKASGGATAAVTAEVRRCMHSSIVVERQHGCVH